MPKPAPTLESRSVNTVWLNLLADIFNKGSNCTPRGKPTRELLGHQTRINMAYPILTEPTRKLGYRFQAAEAAWILSGDNRVSTIAPYSKAISNFSDDGFMFFGAYGPKIVDQLPYVARALTDDADSRQAVLTIWRQSPPKVRDIPCTVSLQWLIRGEKLHCLASMRSSDAWLGWPYDVFNFSMVSLYLLNLLQTIFKESELFQRLELGDLILTAGSQHLYQEQWEGALKAIEAWDYGETPSISSLIRKPPPLVTEALWVMAEVSGGSLDGFKKLSQGELT